MWQGVHSPLHFGGSGSGHAAKSNEQATAPIPERTPDGLRVKDVRLPQDLCAWDRKRPLSNRQWRERNKTGDETEAGGSGGRTCATRSVWTTFGKLSRWASCVDTVDLQVQKLQGMTDGEHHQKPTEVRATESYRCGQSKRKDS